MQKQYTIFSIFGAVFMVMLSVSTQLSAQTVIGGNTPDPSALLDVQSANKGVLFPRVPDPGTIASPATGLIVNNSTTNCLVINMGSPSLPSWQNIKCPLGTVATLACSTPTITSYLMPTVAASGVTITISYTGGNGLNYEAQSISSTGVTGLTANLVAGTFANGSGTLTFTIEGTGGTAGLAIFPFSIGGVSCDLCIPVGCGAFIDANKTWKVFACFNLNSVRTTGDPFTPAWDINGGYWQWGRSAQAAAGPTSASAPNAGTIAGWLTAYAADGSWQDNTKTNDPCPPGFRIPPQSIWQAVRNNNTLSWVGNFNINWVEDANSYNSGIKLGSNLFLPSAGERFPNNGQLSQRNYAGNYWSSTQGTANPNGTGSFMRFAVGDFNFLNFERIRGFSIRCMAE